MPRKRLPHLNARGEARMVEVGGKRETVRTARASGFVRMRAGTLARLVDGDLPKGDALGVARVAGIQGAKRASDLIPLCHPIRITGVELELRPDRKRGGVVIEAVVTTRDRTGVEMEALTAVAVASLALYDMVKGVDRGVAIEEIVLEEKRGGRSGSWSRNG